MLDLEKLERKLEEVLSKMIEEDFDNFRRKMIKLIKYQNKIIKEYEDDRRLARIEIKKTVLDLNMLSDNLSDNLVILLNNEPHLVVDFLLEDGDIKHLELIRCREFTPRPFKLTAEDVENQAYENIYFLTFQNTLEKYRYITESLEVFHRYSI